MCSDEGVAMEHDQDAAVGCTPPTGSIRSAVRRFCPYGCYTISNAEYARHYSASAAANRPPAHH
jgi:hypothetical protein